MLRSKNNNLIWNGSGPRLETGHPVIGYTKLYGSTNATWDSSDTVLWTSNGSTPDYPNTTLNTNKTKTVTATVTIPNVTGTYYIISYVDQVGFHTESNESNNITVYTVILTQNSDINVTALIQNLFLLLDVDKDLDGDGSTIIQGDCNDINISIHTGASEICGDGVDQDCDGKDQVCQLNLDACGIPSGNMFTNGGMFDPIATLDCGQKLKLFLFIKYYHPQFFEYINLKYMAVNGWLTANSYLQITRSTVASIISIAGLVGNPSSKELIATGIGVAGDSGILLTSLLKRDDLGSPGEAISDGVIRTSVCLATALIDPSAGVSCALDQALQGWFDASTALAIYSLNKDMTGLLLAQDFLLEYYKAGGILSIDSVDNFAKEKGWCSGWFCSNDYNIDFVKENIYKVIDKVNIISNNIDPEGDGRPEDIDHDGDLFSKSQGDCNDNDPQINPDTVWYGDYDGDGYSDGTTIIQCSRRLYYYLPSELISMEIDCNDNDSDARPGVGSCL